MAADRVGLAAPIGVPSVDPARVDPPMIDDGPWGGVPIGGLGAGSIGRTHRGDFARWHLEIGEHRLNRSRRTSSRSTSDKEAGEAPRPLDDPAGRAARLGLGPADRAGTYHALFPYAWIDYDWAALPIRIIQRQFSPVIPHNYRESSYPVGIFETPIENRARGRTVGLMFTWQNLVGWSVGEDRRGGHRNETIRRDGLTGVVLAGPGRGRGAVARLVRDRRPR